MKSAKSTGAANYAVDTPRALALLRAMPLLRQLSEESLSGIDAVLKTVHYGPGETIVQHNGEGERLYIILKGEAKVVSPYKEGAIGHTVSTLRCGDYFGLASARQLYKASVFAISEVTCLLLTHDYAGLISGASVWNWSSNPGQGEVAMVERMLELEKLEVDLFRSKLPQLIKTPRKNHSLFGGQLIGQALHAAYGTVNPGYTIHSLHSYFLRMGHENDHVVFQVQRTRDGMSFATRHVQAIQFGKVIFVMYASFKRSDDTSVFQHNEHPMPTAPDPEGITRDELVYDAFLMDPRLPLSIKERYAGVKLSLPPIEMRYCDHTIDKFQRVKMDPRRKIWMRARTKLSDDPIVHSCVAGFSSDIALFETALVCHPEYARSRMLVLSLDHSMHFHGPFRADKWFLYEMESPWTGDGRALCVGRIYQDEQLVITVSQEGLVRRIEDKKEKVAKL